jgi:predicted site-specific integrase-resolvase
MILPDNPHTLTPRQILESYPRWVRLSVAVDLLGVPTKTVLKMVDNGVIRPIHLHPGGRAHYSVAEIAAIIEKRTP